MEQEPRSESFLENWGFNLAVFGAIIAIIGVFGISSAKTSGELEIAGNILKIGLGIALVAGSASFIANKMR